MLSSQQALTPGSGATERAPLVIGDLLASPLERHFASIYADAFRLMKIQGAQSMTDLVSTSDFDSTRQYVHAVAPYAFTTEVGAL